MKTTSVAGAIGVAAILIGIFLPVAQSDSQAIHLGWQAPVFVLYAGLAVISAIIILLDSVRWLVLTGGAAAGYSIYYLLYAFNGGVFSSGLSPGVGLFLLVAGSLAVFWSGVHTMVVGRSVESTSIEPDMPVQPAFVADELTRLKALHDGGALTADEFEIAKRKVLGKAA